MDNFNISLLISWVLSICSGIAVVSTATVWIVRGVQVIRAPRKKLEERIEKREAEVEKRLKQLEIAAQEFQGFFNADKNRLDDLEAGNRVTQQAILALLSHAIDGNDTKSLEEAKAALHAYLLAK